MKFDLVLRKLRMILLVKEIREPNHADHVIGRLGFRCGLVSITSPVSLLANEFDVRSVLHLRVSLAAVNQIYVFHRAINGCKNLKIHLRLASKI